MTAESIMPKKDRLILWFKEIRNDDVALVGGKVASLGEMLGKLKEKGVKVPNGFAITVRGYNLFIKQSPGLQEHIEAELQKVRSVFQNLQNSKEILDSHSSESEGPVSEGAKRKYNESNRTFQLVLEESGVRIRERIYQASLPEVLAKEIDRAYKVLSQEIGLDNSRRNQTKGNRRI